MKIFLFFSILFISASFLISKPVSVTCFAEDKNKSAGPNTKSISRVNGSTECQAVPSSKESFYSKGKAESSLKFRKLFPLVAGDQCRQSQYSQQDSYTKAEAKATVILLGLPPHKVAVDEKLWVRIYGTLEIFNSDPSVKARIEGCVNGTDKIVEFTEIQKLATITPTVIRGSAELTPSGFTKSGVFNTKWTDRTSFMCADNDQSILGIYDGKEIDLLIEINLKDVYPRKIAKLDMCVKVSGFARDFASRADFFTGDYIVGIFVYNPKGNNNNNNNQNQQNQNQNTPPRKGQNKPFIGIAPLQNPYLVLLPGAKMPPNTKFSTNLKDIALFQFNAKAYNGDINIAKFIITVSNDYNSIAEASLYIDKDGDGKLSNNDVLLGTAKVDTSGKLKFAVNETITKDSDRNYLVVVSTSDVNPKDDIQLSILLNSDVEVTTKDADVLGAPIYSALLEAVQTAGKKKGCSSLSTGLFIILLLPIFLLKVLRLFPRL